MSSSQAAVPAPGLPALREGAPVLLAALLGLAAWGALFHVEAAAAVRVWLDSTAYSHCFFVLPIAAWLAWDRRPAARGLRPHPALWPALAVLPCALAWFAAERLGIMEGRQLAAVGMLVALAGALLGWRLAWLFSSALLYLFFLVPFGEFLTPDLQRVTAWCVEVGLTLLAIPHVVDAFTIEVPGAEFYVAEACAGLRFLIAAVAFGVLYACLTYRSPWRRLAFIAACCTVPILANGVRALGIVVAGYLIGSAEAAVADHLIYGWGFFSVVILLLTLAGLPFRQDLQAVAPPAPDAAAPAGIGRALAAAAATLVLAALAPLASAGLQRADALPALALPRFVATPGCAPLGDPQTPAPGLLVQHFGCGGGLTATLQVLPPHAAPAALRAARAAATGEHAASDSVTDTLTLATDPPLAWRTVELHEPDRLSATAVWTHGAPDAGGLAGRLRLAWDSVAGGGVSPVLVAVSLDQVTLLHADDLAKARAVLRGFLQGQGALLAAAAALSAAP